MNVTKSHIFTNFYVFIDSYTHVGVLVKSFIKYGFFNDTILWLWMLYIHTIFNS